MGRRRHRDDRPQSFAVWSHINGLNQGDDLVVETVIDAIRQRAETPRVVTISMYPAGSLGRHGVESWPIGAVPSGQNRRAWSAAGGGRLARVARLPIRAITELRSLGQVWMRLRGIDTLVIAGSGPLEDDPGCAYRLAKWVAVGRLAGARVAILSVGAGPLEKPMNQRLVRLALGLSHYASVRDTSSAALVARIGYRRQLPVRPDMGWAWPLLSASRPVADATREHRVVGINVMSLNDPRSERGIALEQPDLERFDTYLGKLTTITQHLLEADDKVLLFSTETQHDVTLREELADRVREGGTPNSDHLELQTDLTAAGTLRCISACDVVVATRFHTAMLGVASGVPTVALAYHAKTRDLFDTLGISDLCLDAENFQPADLLQAIERAPAVWNERQHHIAAVIEDRRRQIDAQFDEALTP